MQRENTIFLNGDFLIENAVKIDPSDRGLLLADGLFETMKAYAGQICFFEKHWARFKKSADYLDIPVPFNQSQLKSIAEELLRNNQLHDQPATLRLTLTRGPAPRGVIPPSLVKPTLLLTAFPWVKPPLFASLKIVNIRRNELSPLSQIKSLNYLDNVLARREAIQAGATDAILLNTKENVAETSIANIFCINQEGELVTPRIADGALPGVIRHEVLLLAEKLSIPSIEKSLLIDDLKQAREVFLTNSLIGIQSVNRIEEHFILQDITGTQTEIIAKALSQSLHLSHFSS